MAGYDFVLPEIQRLVNTNDSNSNDNDDSKNTVHTYNNNNNSNESKAVDAIVIDDAMNHHAIQVSINNQYR